MNSRHTGLFVVLAVVAAACSGGGGSGAPSFHAGDVRAAAKSLTVGSLTGRDVVGEELTSAMGVAEALGGEADRILGLAKTARDGAVAQLATAAPAASGFRRPARIGVNDILWLLVQQDLAAALDNGTETAVDEQSSQTQTTTSTTPGTGASATSTVTQTSTVSTVSSRVQLEIHRVENVVVTDDKGVVSFESTDDRTVTGSIEVCPNILGVSNASMRIKVTIDATTHPGAAGRVGVHVLGHASTSSAFAGHVGNDAALQNVTQDFQKSSDWKRSAAAEGGPVRDQSGTLDVAFNGISTAADAAGDVNVGGMSVAGMTGTAGVTGNGTQEMINNTIGNAAMDVIALTPSYKEAQRLWRNGRCVVVAIPAYNAETSIHTETQNASQHTENVDRSSSTQFTVSEHHRFESSPIAKEIVAELTSGDKSLDPKSLPSGSGALTYVAPDESGKDATVKLTSTSNRGIGTLVVTFHTASVKVEVSISGSEFFDDFLPLTFTLPTMVLTKRADGSFEGTGTSKMEGSLGPCSPAMTESGTIGLTATQAAPADGTTKGPWSVVSEQIPSNTDIKFYCDGQNLAGAFSPLGVGYDFVKDLGTITVPADGGTVTVHNQNASYGPLDATVTVKITVDEG